MVKQKVVFIMIPPATGHLNPLCCIASELVKRYNLKVIIFGNEKFRESIERFDAIYRPYSDFDMESIHKREGDTVKFNPLNTFNFLMETGAKLLPELYKACKEEEPRVIILDNLSFHAKYLASYIEVQQKIGKLNFFPPKIMGIFSTFGTLFNIYPNDEERSKFYKHISSEIMEKISLKQQKMNEILGINIEPTFFNLTGPIEKLNISCVFKELQPRADQLKHKYIFSGCCINENLRNEQITDKGIKSLLESFKPKNPLYLNEREENRDEDFKLIYASLGTIFNKNTEIFEKIIDSIRTFHVVEDNKLKANNIKLLVSMGKESLNILKNKIENQKYILPNNVYLASSVPQIEVLKRASLFITHCGMNSTSETIHYGVPVIGIPIMADQPLNAFRICDELNFGKRLITETFRAEELRDAVKEVLENPFYLRNVLEFTKLSRNCNGIENAAKIINDYINN